VTNEDIQEELLSWPEDCPVLVLRPNGKTYRINEVEYLDGAILLLMGEEHEP
jgi:hypothetical protein